MTGAAEDSALTLDLSSVPIEEGLELHISLDWEAEVYQGDDLPLALAVHVDAPGAVSLANDEIVSGLPPGPDSGHFEWDAALPNLDEYASFDQAMLDGLQLRFTLNGSFGDWAAIKNLTVALTHTVPTDLDRNNRLANTKERDASIGLDNHGFRYYDADAGRYITRDPIGYKDGLNVYNHVGNNPVNDVDPLGLDAIREQTGMLLVRLNDLQARKNYDYEANGGRPGPNSAALWTEIQSTKAEIISLGKASSTDVATAYAKGFAEGARTGAKAAVNATADTVVSTVTLGQGTIDPLIAVTDEDMSIGYGGAYAFARGGSEFIAGGLTGGLSKVGTVGKIVTAYDVAGNVVNFGQGAANAVENGITLANGTQMIAGAAGLGGNVVGVMKGSRAATLATDGCFVAGTLVLTGDGELVPIESVEIGDRLATDGGLSNNGAVAEDPDATDVDPVTWRQVTLTVDAGWDPGDADLIRIKTLVPPEWLARNRADVGRYVTAPLDLEELGVRADTPGLITAIDRVGEIESGPGRVVLTTIDRPNDFVFNLTLSDVSGELDTLGVTGWHKFFSETRGWVNAMDLEEGEAVRGHSGTMRVTSIASLPGLHRVYNFSVEADHVYYVGDLSTLTHNNDSCLTDGLVESSRRAARTGSETSRGVQSLQKKIDRGDMKYGTEKTQEAAERQIREITGDIQYAGSGGIGRDVFIQDSTSRTIRMRDGEFDTFM